MTNKNRLFLDIHAIQTVPPSNINRDDTGSPKTAEYGGVRRSRVSSQSWKRAIRNYFNDNGDQANVGVRTLEIVRYVADKILAIDSSIGEEKALEMADKVLNDAKVKTKDQRAKALFFLGDIQAEQLAQAAVNEIDDKNILQSYLKENPSIDIALFGRMVADDPSLNEDASAQVAHAISTHAVHTEFDFYTAVDDLAPEDNAGAGMLGTIEYNSSTLYRYANVAVHELASQLKNQEVIVNTLSLFVEAFVNSMPTGKINTFANQTLPQAVLLVLREDRPVNLVGAFEKPVNSHNGYVKKSIELLLEENTKTQKMVKQPLASFFLTTEDIGENRDLINLNKVASLSELQERLISDIEASNPEMGD